LGNTDSDVRRARRSLKLRACGPTLQVNDLGSNLVLLAQPRVLYAGEYENVPYQHKPDAHVLFCGHVFIVERQTAESKVGPAKIYEKVEGHKRYVELRLHKPAEVLFAFDGDDSPMIDTARRAGEQYGIEVVGRDVTGIADYLYNAALRLSP
jgi:hypothetical protein